MGTFLKLSQQLVPGVSLVNNLTSGCVRIVGPSQRSLHALLSLLNRRVDASHHSSEHTGSQGTSLTAVHNADRHTHDISQSLHHKRGLLGNSSDGKHGLDVHSFRDKTLDYRP